jgi:biopolymer transport protein ExbD
VLAGGDDPVLAIRRGAAWETLPAMALPVVPVPFSTGETWNHVKPPRSPGAVLDSERVTLSILVTPKQIWVGVSRINEFQEISAEPGQLDKLLEALKERKASAFFVDRTDLEIAGEADAMYGEVAEVIEVATTAGFVDWKITEPGRLVARPTL